MLFSSVDYVSVKGEIIWYLSLTAWLISLSIMLESKDLLLIRRIMSVYTDDFSSVNVQLDDIEGD